MMLHYCIYNTTCFSLQHSKHDSSAHGLFVTNEIGTLVAEHDNMGQNVARYGNTWQRVRT